MGLKKNYRERKNAEESEITVDLFEFIKLKKFIKDHVTGSWRRQTKKKY